MKDDVQVEESKAVTNGGKAVDKAFATGDNDSVETTTKITNGKDAITAPLVNNGNIEVNGRVRTASETDAFEEELLEPDPANESHSSSACETEKSLNLFLSDEEDGGSVSIVKMATPSTAPVLEAAVTDHVGENGLAEVDERKLNSAKTDRLTSVSTLKRSSVRLTEDVAAKRSKLVNGSLVDSKNVPDADKVENVAVKPSKKRASDKINPLLEVKKVRIGGEIKEDAESEQSSEKTVVNDTTDDAKTDPKKLSNLQRAIDRVATGGLNNKRKREICEFLRMVEDKSLKEITTNDLEELVCHKLCEVVTERSEVGNMRQTVNSLSASVEKWRSSTRQMSKQIKDLELVFKRLVADSKVHPQTLAPIKITRSVGLQVGQPHMVPAAVPAPLPKKTLPTKSELQKASQQRTGGIMTNRNMVAGPAATPRTGPPTASAGTNTAPSPLKSPLVVNRVVGPLSRTTPPGQELNRPANVPTIPGNVSVTARPTIRTMPAQTGSSLRVRMPAPQQPRVRLPITSSNSNPSDNLIDLTDEDDKKTPTPAANPTSPSTRGMNAMNHQRPGNNAIRVVNQNQLTGNTTSGFNAPRLAYVLPNNVGGGGGAPGATTQARSSVFYMSNAGQQMAGRPARNFVTTVTRPMTTQPQQMLLISPPKAVATRPANQTAVRSVLPSMQQMVNRVRPLANAVVPANRPPVAYRQVLHPVLVHHPAPLPQLPNVFPSNPHWKLPPPQPDLKISKSDQRQKGIILSWKMDTYSEDQHEIIATYQLYAYQETSTLPSTNMWKKVGDVKSMPLPMACTLTQFSEGNKYHFAVRALDSRGRHGPFSIPGSILLTSGD